MTGTSPFNASFLKEISQHFLLQSNTDGQISMIVTGLSHGDRSTFLYLEWLDATSEPGEIISPRGFIFLLHHAIWQLLIYFMTPIQLFRLLTLHVRMVGPPLWSKGQSSWLQIQRSGFDSRRYQIFWEVVGLERGSLSLVSATEELLGRKSSGSGVENREYGRRDPSRWPRNTLYPQKFAVTFPTSGGSSVGIASSRTKATEFVFVKIIVYHQYGRMWKRWPG
jgi:hypothetical protein